MDFGAHLPLMDFGGNPLHPRTSRRLHRDRGAARLSFSALSTNDHMVFSVPWLDGPTAFVAMIGRKVSWSNTWRVVARVSGSSLVGS